MSTQAERDAIMRALDREINPSCQISISARDFQRAQSLAGGMVELVHAGDDEGAADLYDQAVKLFTRRCGS